MSFCGTFQSGPVQFSLGAVVPLATVIGYEPSEIDLSALPRSLDAFGPTRSTAPHFSSGRSENPRPRPARWTALAGRVEADARRTGRESGWRNRVSYRRTVGEHGCARDVFR